MSAPRRVRRGAVGVRVVMRFEEDGAHVAVRAATDTAIAGVST